MATFHFDLVSPEKLLFSGEVDQVDIPGSEGDFGVFAGHAPMVAMLRPGLVTIHQGSKTEKVVVLGGFVEVSAAGLTLLAEVAANVAELDRAMLAAHIKQSEKRIAELEAGSALDREIERLDHFKTLDYHLSGTALH